MANIKTLVQDVYSIIGDGVDTEDKEVQEVIEDFGKNVATTLRRRLSKDREHSTGLRLSSLGQCITKQYLDQHSDNEREELQPHTLIKFLFGDLIEEMLLAMIKLSGHEVRGEQDDVEVEGIPGHRDVVIDEHTIDIKSASARGFMKFADGSLIDNDPFGYITQLTSYTEGADDVDKSASYFLALHKEMGKLALFELKQEDMPNVKRRAHEVKEAMDQPFPPARPHKPVEHGKKGNMKLPVTCSYCHHKFECWKEANNGKGLRTFLYSTGPVHMTTVEDEPRVEEAV